MLAAFQRSPDFIALLKVVSQKQFYFSHLLLFDLFQLSMLLFNLLATVGDTAGSQVM